MSTSEKETQPALSQQNRNFMEGFNSQLSMVDQNAQPQELEQSETIEGDLNDLILAKEEFTI